MAMFKLTTIRHKNGRLDDAIVFINESGEEVAVTSSAIRQLSSYVEGEIDHECVNFKTFMVFDGNTDRIVKFQFDDMVGTEGKITIDNGGLNPIASFEFREIHEFLRRFYFY